MSCCPTDSEPPRAAAAHVSSLITVGDKTTIYRAGPATANIGLLAFPDIFGLDSGRAKQDADALGELGYAVAFVDLTAGDYAYDGWDMGAWMKKQDFDTVLMPRIKDAIQHLQHDAKVQTIASYGYCWGAWVGARLSAEEGTLIKGHVSFHPSWVVENRLYGDGKIEELAQRVRVPQLLLSASNDKDELKEGGSVQTILGESSTGAVAALSQVIDFPDVKHGWVNRGDVSEAAVQQSVTKAWGLARTFLQSITAL